jgi:antitoxin component YwqK of YwqJK toxin-antitoxin module
MINRSRVRSKSGHNICSHYSIRKRFTHINFNIKKSKLIKSTKHFLHSRDKRKKTLSPQNNLQQQILNKYKFKIKNGKGILREYHDNGKLKFGGEYINGNKKGKKYCDKGELIFEEEYLKGKKWNGKIK